ncbi:MAG: prephenate dehydrogenase [Candidatus Omnitrophica bacterium]|nr:prephenate dehydrogenase [Candidatus Omnitrophota bacterium]
MFKKVGIVGTGLIGGSIAIAIKKSGIAKRIVGVCRHKESLLLAKKNRIVDEASLSLEVLKDVDFLILATPVNVIINLSERISKIIPKNCIVTDVGSTKGEIVSVLEKNFSNYVGSHPMAGSEKRGVVNANAGIFKNTICFLTPTKKSEKKVIEALGNFWEKLGAKVILLNPEKHDFILSFVSHLPHIAAFSLISSIPSDLLKFGSTGLKDTTRIASSDGQIWADILLSNRKNLIKAIDIYQDEISGLKHAIQRNDRKALCGFLKKAKAKREILA